MPLPQPTQKTILFFCFAILFSISGIGQSSFFVDDAENVYKCGPDWVKKYAPGDTEGVIVAGGNGKGGEANQLYNPSAVIVDEKENIFICDKNNHRIQKWGKGVKNGITLAGGNGIGIASNQLNFPETFLFDLKGNLIIGDPNNYRIQKWLANTSNGITVAGGNGSIYSENQLFDPRGGFLLENDTTLLIVDSNGSKIIRWIMGEKSGKPVITRETDSNILFPVDVWKDKFGSIVFLDIEMGPRYFLIFPDSKKGINISTPMSKLFIRNGEFYELTSENRIVKYPLLKIAEKSVSQKTFIAYYEKYFLTQTNDLIAKIIPDEANLTMGEVAASVVIDAVQDQSFVKRHYKIETNNPAHKSKISLYFTQAEFDEYNKLNDKKLPANSTDKNGIANVIVTSQIISTSRRALPIQTTIEIPDNQIVWNENLKVWEVSFEDSGSKEYWLKTKFEYKQSTNPRREIPVFTKKNMREGVEEMEVFESKPFEIYPNPVSKSFSLQINDTKLIGSQAFIKNEVGVGFKTIQITKKVESITTENWPAGIYLIEFSDGKVGKFLKE